MGVGDIVRSEFIELPRFQRIEHPHVADRQGDRGLRRAVEQANGLPAWRIVLLRDAAFEPYGGAGDQERMQAGCVAGAFVEQILQAAADFDGEDIRYYVAAATTATRFANQSITI